MQLLARSQHVSNSDGSPVVGGMTCGLSRLAWLPVPILLVAIISLWAANLQGVYESRLLAMGLNLVTRTLPSVLIVYLAGRSFLARGEPGLLMLGCGVAAWGATGLVTSALLTKDANSGVTISSTGLWLAALCHLVGTVVSLRSERAIRPAGLWLGVGYALALAAVALLTLAAFAGWLPVFFVQGDGGTPVRHMVLGSALAMFVLGAVLLWEGNRRSLSPFVHWYTLALMLLAAAVFGLMIESSRASALDWVCRAGQYVSGIYMLIAAQASRRAPGARQITLGQATGASRYPYGAAIAIVVSAAAVRLAFLSMLGTRVTFITFYPAVVLAALYGGLGAGLLATILSALLADYFWIEPAGQIFLGNTADWLGLALFVVSGTMISWITQAMRHAQQRAMAAEAKTSVAAEKLRAAEALRESEERFRTAFEDGPIPMAITAMDCTILKVNAAFCRMLGYTEAELVGRDFADFTHPEDLDENRAGIQSLASGQTPSFHMVKRYFGKDGSIIWGDLSSISVRGVHGKPLYLVTHVQDITERKGAEEVLHRYELLANQSRDIILFIDRDDGRILEGNAAAVQAYGYPPEELRARTIADLRAPETRQLTAQQLADADTQGILFETVHQRKDGSLFPVEVSSRGATINGRRTLVSLVRDITERKQAESDEVMATELLRVLNRGDGDLHRLIAEVLRLLKDSTGFDAVGLRLREGDDCPYYQQDGLSADFLREENFLCARGGDGAIVRDASGQAVLECTCGLVLSGRTDPAMSCFTEGGSFWTNRSPELLALTPEVDPRTNPRNRCIHTGYESVALMPVRSGEQIIGLLQLNDRRPGRFTPERIRFFEGLAANLGLALQRQQSEKALATAKEVAESASRAKDHFLAVLSHELRNPLNPVLATAAMLQADPRFDADTREQLEVICRNAELEARLIDDLLDVTRIERGKIELNRQPIELRTVIRRAVEVCLPDLETRKLEFGIDMPEGSYLIDADAARLQQVFWNLLKNAIKFTPVGGCVGVRCRCDGGGFVVAEVNDSGEGIDPEVLPRLFNAFEQGGRPTTRQFGGLGLGLAISKAIAELHGGSIQAHSQGKGKGATFTVRLPLVPARATVRSTRPTVQSPPPVAAIRPLRILLVEDHGDTARVMRRLLSAGGHEVQLAADVATALTLAEQPFDLLLSDLGLPDGSGLDLMRALRAKGVGLPGIALSGYGQESDLQQSRDAGFAAHLVKPVDVRRLKETIDRVVPGGRPVDPDR